MELALMHVGCVKYVSVASGLGIVSSAPFFPGK